MDGGTIFLPMLPPVSRYLLSTAIQFIVGIFIILTLQMVFDLFSLIGVGLLNQSPALWPPVHDEPWHMSSLHEFWSKRWHQILRSVFLVMGGYPGRWIAGDVGMLFGTFIASGMYHEVSLCMGGAPFDVRVLVFFVAQAFGILAENAYRRTTGKRVSGWAGWLWGAIFLLGIGQLRCWAVFLDAVDSRHESKYGKRRRIDALSARTPASLRPVLASNGRCPHNALSFSIYH
ncbi:hypothetical protein TRAPUB_7945 [Trametes pubescens]|uniref:Wax synthase domain-containing protein n=1 Tax=Trametes pubescens TaxID=154538 RepID=A0A1M2V1Z0_TRAPU|nr:hypothetical protein TRAPUB_7945 [Trametes pubescens]